MPLPDPTMDGGAPRRESLFLYQALTLVMLTLVVATAGGLTLVALKSRIATVAKGTERVERATADLERKVQFLDAKIATVHNPDFLRSRVDRYRLPLGPPAAGQVVHLEAPDTGRLAADGEGIPTPGNGGRTAAAAVGGARAVASPPLGVNASGGVIDPGVAGFILPGAGAGSDPAPALAVAAGSGAAGQEPFTYSFNLAFLTEPAGETAGAGDADEGE